MPKTKPIMLPTQEDIKTEFKQSFTDDVIIALVAFANAKGGKVYVGMRDNGTVCGVSLGKEAQQTWLNEIKQKTEPSIIPDIDVIDVDGKQVVVLSVQEYPVKPVSTKGRYYVRQANSNHLMTAFEISNSILQTKNSSWDYYPCPGKSLSDIDIEKIATKIRDRAGSEITQLYNPATNMAKLYSQTNDIAISVTITFTGSETSASVDYSLFDENLNIVTSGTLTKTFNAGTYTGSVRLSFYSIPSTTLQAYDARYIRIDSIIPSNYGLIKVHRSSVGSAYVDYDPSKLLSFPEGFISAIDALEPVDTTTNFYIRYTFVEDVTIAKGDFTIVSFTAVRTAAGGTVPNTPMDLYTLRYSLEELGIFKKSTAAIPDTLYIINFDPNTSNQTIGVSVKISALASNVTIPHGSYFNILITGHKFSIQ